MFSNYNYFIFDLDGTLFDTNKMKSECFIDSICNSSVGKEDLFLCDRLSLGYKRAERFSRLFEKAYDRSPTDDELSEGLVRYQTLYRNRMRYSVEISGAVRFLKALKRKGKSIFLVSATSKEDLDLFCQIHEITHFFFEIASSSLCNKESIVEKWIEKKGVKKSECIFFGDTEVDRKAASTIEIDFWAIFGADFRKTQNVLGSQNFLQLIQHV